ncbi:hypothetical protein GCM10022419_019360 [Nonomuraea rosea]|uniref:Secreted protein n=1 Tax=Nonomuraea rosea TaxID=638574 RepID=A0ABP6VQR4_9ACTN
MITARRLTTLGVTIVALLGFGAVPPASAFAPVNSPVRAAGPMTFAQQRPAFSAVARCSNEFSGRVTADRGTGRGGEARIDRISFANCDSGLAVTPRALPWALALDSSRTITLRNVDIDVRTSRGTCRFTGDLLNGFFDNTLGLYNISGVLHRRSAGCGVGDTLGLDTGFQELILVNGTGLTL